MKANMGRTDKVIRVFIAVVVGVLYWQGIIEGILAYILMAFAIIFLLTSLISFCPLYTIFGLNTCRRK